MTGQRTGRIPTAPQQPSVLEQLRRLSGTTVSVRPDRRALGPEEVARLGQGGLMDVGAHAVTHAELARLPVTDQYREIYDSKAQLERVLDRPVRAFSYPHGSYTEETVAAVRQAGYAYACSSHNDLVWRRTDCSRLPRIEVRDWDQNTFAHRLHRWL